MAGKLEGKVAVVTGSGRGIGRAEALLLAREGAAVVVNDLGVNLDGSRPESSPADEVVAEIKAAGGQAVASYDSVATFEGGKKIVNCALQSLGRLDIVVNNAGFSRDRMCFNMTEEEWDSIIGVHLTGHFAVARAAAPIFRQQRSGRIINTSSEAGLGVSLGQTNYSSAKEGIIGLTRSMARELGRYSVTVNAIRPSAGTRMNTSPATWEAARKAAAAGSTKLLEAMHTRETRRPEHVAPLVVWLCTDAASHVNGRTFYVSGPIVSLYSEPEPIRTLYAPNDIWTIDQLTDAMSSIVRDLVNPSPPQE